MRLSKYNKQAGIRTRPSSDSSDTKGKTNKKNERNNNSESKALK